MPLTYNDPDNAMIHEQQRQIDALSQALADKREPPPMAGKCKDLQSKLVSILTDISTNLGLLTQALLDDIYAQVLTQIGTSRTSRANKKGRGGPRPKPVTRGRGRNTDMREHKISSARTRTCWPDISTKMYHG